MLRRDITSDDDSICSDTTEDDSFDISSDDSEDESVIMNQRKRLRTQSESSESSFSETEVLTFTEIPPAKSFTKATNVFSEIPGPRCAPSSDAGAIAYFNIYFTELLLETIVKETNKCALQFLDTRIVLENSRVKRWTPTTIQEIRAFIGVLLEMGITRRPTIHSYWRQDSRQIPWFGKMFSRDRFLLILKFFRLVDNRLLAEPGHPEYNPCGSFDMLVNHVNTVFTQHYVPHQQLYIDESLVGTDFLPNKNHLKRGIKFWMLCDSVTKYCLGFLCNKGVKNVEDKDLIKKGGFGFVLIQKLLSIGNYLNKGYHLYIDNFYTSLRLVKALLQRNTYLTGTIRCNRKEIPVEAKKANGGEAKYFANENVLICSFKDNKSEQHPVILISSNAGTHNVTIKKKRGNFEYEKENPSMIHDFNKYMGGVDEPEKMYIYLDERRTLTYWKKVVFSIFGRMVLNAYILYTSNTAEIKKKSRLQFTSEIIGDIEKEWMTHKNEKSTQASPTNQKFALEKLPGRNLRQCVVCSSRQNGIKRSNLICARCKKGLHALCAGNHNC